MGFVLEPPPPHGLLLLARLNVRSRCAGAKSAVHLVQQQVTRHPFPLLLFFDYASYLVVVVAAAVAGFSAAAAADAAVSAAVARFAAAAAAAPAAAAFAV